MVTINTKQLLGKFHSTEMDVGELKKLIKDFILDTHPKDKIKSLDILNCLFQQGIKTVYIEGGAITTSNFLNDRAIDILQLHLSPYLFGSGKQGIVLPDIEKIDESIQFQNFSFFTVGDSVMFVGQPN